MGPMIGHGENGGQWWIPVPNQVDGTPPPASVRANRIVNIGGGDHFLFGQYNADNESFVPWAVEPPKPTSTRATRLATGAAGPSPEPLRASSRQPLKSNPIVSRPTTNTLPPKQLAAANAPVPPLTLTP